MAIAVYAVAATIVVDGAKLTRDVDVHVEQVLVDEDVSLPAMFAITMQDPRRDILERSGLRAGADVEISISGQGSSTDEPLVMGEVVTIECDYDEFGSRVVARGYAASHRLHPGRHTRTFLNATDSEIVKQVAEAADIELGDIEETSEAHEHVTQPNVSDWEFLTTRARAIGYELAVVDDKLHFGKPTPSADAPGPQNPTSGGQLGYQAHVLIEGESLHSVAWAEYGKASYWRALAEVNDIDDPLRVSPGTRILLPPRREAARRS